MPVSVRREPLHEFRIFFLTSCSDAHSYGCCGHIALTIDRGAFVGNRTDETTPGALLMGDRLPIGASYGGADSVTAAGWTPPVEKGVAVQLDHFDPRRRNRLLAALPAADFSLLAPHLKEVPLEQGAVLQEQGELTEEVYFLHEGIVSLLVPMRQGEAIEIATVGREGAIGSLAGHGPRRSHTGAVVQVAGTASRITAARFRKAAEESRAIRDIIVSYGEMLLIQVQQTAACNALHDVEERLSRWLLQAHDRVDGNMIHLTHEFLSQMLGVRRPTVTVVAHMLQKAGLIRYHRGRIEVLDRPGLEARACECYEIISTAIRDVMPPPRR